MYLCLQMSALLTYALDKNGAMAHVDAVANGAECECLCPHCHAPLVAKNGVPRGGRQHHFAHANGHECSGAYESSIHLLAKEVLKEARCICLPITGDRRLPSGHVVLRNIEAEKSDKTYGIKPDLEGIMTNGERLLIEFNFTHKVDLHKRKVIVENHLKCVEIDLKYQAIDKISLREFLINSDERRRWIVAMPPTIPSKESFSFSSGRKDIFIKTREILKEVFDSNNFWIKPFHWKRQYYDLKALGYDVCEVGANYLGFKADLLVYRSRKENKGRIAICLRGKKRSECDRPKDLRVIDIVINTDLKENYIREFFQSGKFDEAYSIHYNYFGFEFLKSR